MPPLRLCTAVLLAAVTGAAEPTGWEGLAPRQASLVYAAPADSGTAGMFGHVLVLVRGEHGAVAVGWAATIGDDSVPELAWNSLTGAYQAHCEITPWDTVRRDYQQVERRPLWIYDLDLGEGGLRRLLDSVAADQGQQHPYHLLGDNCANGIARLLDTARPEARMGERTGWVAMPIDVVRAAHDAGIAGDGRLVVDPLPLTRLGGDPIHDHRSGRLLAVGGIEQDHTFVDLDLRPAWHGALDPPGSIPLGDALTVLGVAGRWTSGEAPCLQRIDLVAIESFALRPDRHVGWTWSGRLGSDRERVGRDGDAQQQGGGSFGLGGSWAPAPGALVFALGIIDARLVENLERPAAGAGGEVGLRAASGRVIGELRFQALGWAGELRGATYRASSGITTVINDRMSLQLAGGWERAWDWEAGYAQAGLGVYF